MAAWKLARLLPNALLPPPAPGALPALAEAAICCVQGMRNGDGSRQSKRATFERLAYTAALDLPAATRLHLQLPRTLVQAKREVERYTVSRAAHTPDEVSGLLVTIDSLAVHLLGPARWCVGAGGAGRLPYGMHVSPAAWVLPDAGRSRSSPHCNLAMHVHPILALRRTRAAC